MLAACAETRPDSQRFPLLAKACQLELFHDPSVPLTNPYQVKLSIALPDRSVDFEQAVAKGQVIHFTHMDSRDRDLCLGQAFTFDNRGSEMRYHFEVAQRVQPTGKIVQLTDDGVVSFAPGSVTKNVDGHTYTITISRQR